MPGLRSRAQRVVDVRGDAPRLALIAFGEHGTAPHVERKLSACSEAGVEAVALVLNPQISPEAGCMAIADLLSRTRFDGAFLQFPFPDEINAAELLAGIPPEIDTDVMTPPCVAEYFRNVAALPPVTVSAGLALLQEYGIPIDDKHGVVVADPSEFALMFREALVREGCFMHPIISPADEDLPLMLQRVQLVVVAAARPSSVRARDLAAGAFTIDVGYFNPGGRGDIDTSTGISHLAAIAKVPGGIGPMTVSALIERVILFAERRVAF